MELKSGFEIIARRAQVPGRPSHIPMASGVPFARSRADATFRKLPRGLRRRTTVSFAALRSALKATPPRPAYRQIPQFHSR